MKSVHTFLEIDKDSQLASILTDSVPDIRVESAYRYPFLYIVIYLAVICVLDFSNHSSREGGSVAVEPTAHCAVESIVSLTGVSVVPNLKDVFVSGTTWVGGDNGRGVDHTLADLRHVLLLQGFST